MKLQLLFLVAISSQAFAIESPMTREELNSIGIPETKVSQFEDLESELNQMEVVDIPVSKKPVVNPVVNKRLPICHRFKVFKAWACEPRIDSDCFCKKERK